tara:strand:+ start:505 stop:1908 length:1404 start_codon:yes stop_codon:yes gene_type:complete
MAIIRESVNLTAGLGETIYTVPAGKQASLTVSVANAANTYVALQTTDLANDPVTNLETTFANTNFQAFTTTVGYEFQGDDTPSLYRRQASNKYARDSSSYYAGTFFTFTIPRSASFNYDAAVADMNSNDIWWRPNGAFDSTGRTRTGDGVISNFNGGFAAIGTEGLSFENANGDYIQYQNIELTSSLYTVTSGHYFGFSFNGWTPNMLCGANLIQGNSTHYIYKQMWKSTEAPLVVMWNAGDIGTGSNNTLSRAIQFTGIPNGRGIMWIQESGSYTMICTLAGETQGASTPEVYIVNNSAWNSGTTNGLGASSTCTNITQTEWSSISNTIWYKPFVVTNDGMFYFRNPSSPYPFTYDATTDTWDFSATPTVQTYPAEISGLEATLGDAYSFYKYSSTLNDYYITAGTSVYSLIPNYNSLDANSSLLTGLQNNSEKGGLALKAGDKIISYDTLTGGTVVQVYGYEEDA